MTSIHRPSRASSFARALRRLPTAFRPDRAAGSSARVHFAATGPEPGNWMVTVRNGRCIVEEGAMPGTRPIIHVPSDVWLLIAERQLDPEAALDQGLLYFEGDRELFSKLRDWFV